MKEDLVDHTLERLSFELSYAHDEGRYFWAGGIMGDRIPDAAEKGNTISNEWSQDDIGFQTSEHDIIREAFRAAIGEAVHEALEWFRVDGEVLLNPHGESEFDILNRSSEFADVLWTLIDREFSKE